MYTGISPKMYQLTYHEHDISDCNANIGDYYLTLFLQEGHLPEKIHQGIEPTINEGSLNVKKTYIQKDSFVCVDQCTL